MSQHVFLITGATDGIGLALARAIADVRSGDDADVTIVMHGRNEEKLSAVAAEVQATTGAIIETILADLASLEQVAQLANEIETRFPGLNVLINNAGHLTDHRQLSADGHELTFAVNYLAPYFLTRRLVPLLQANAPARIVNVASTAMGGGHIDFADLELEQGFDGWQAYANSKLMNVWFSSVLAAQLEGSGVVSNSLCPGLIDTNFFHTNNLFAERYEAMRGHMRTPDEGALVPLYLATAPEAGSISGEFFVREGRDNRRAVPVNIDAAQAELLWRYTESLVAKYL